MVHEVSYISQSVLCPSFCVESLCGNQNDEANLLVMSPVFIQTWFLKKWKDWAPASLHF